MLISANDVLDNAPPNKVSQLSEDPTPEQFGPDDGVDCKLERDIVKKNGRYMSDRERDTPPSNNKQK